MIAFTPPSRDCSLCPRLVAFREENRHTKPDWHNAPVPAFGQLDAPLLIIGLAPGLNGANRTGRPFTGDYAGELLYETLFDSGLAEGTYDRRADDGFTLINCRVSNSVRCVPPANKPLPVEIKNCRNFLISEIAAMPNLKGILLLGRIAHESLLRTLDLKLSQFPFAHGKLHETLGPKGPLILADSYHCSRYNTNTGRLTTEMFRTVVGELVARIKI